MKNSYEGVKIALNFSENLLMYFIDKIMYFIDEIMVFIDKRILR
jgi:hypothetical protein